MLCHIQSGFQCPFFDYDSLKRRRAEIESEPINQPDKASSTLEGYDDQPMSYRVSRPLFHCRDTHIVILLRFHKNSPKKNSQLSNRGEKAIQQRSPFLTEWMSPLPLWFACPHRPCNVDRTKMGSQHKVKSASSHAIDRPQQESSDSKYILRRLLSAVMHLYKCIPMPVRNAWLCLRKSIRDLLAGSRCATTSGNILCMEQVPSRFRSPKTWCNHDISPRIASETTRHWHSIVISFFFSFIPLIHQAAVRNPKKGGVGGNAAWLHNELFYPSQ